MLDTNGLITRRENDVKFFTCLENPEHELKEGRELAKIIVDDGKNFMFYF